VVEWGGTKINAVQLHSMAEPEPCDRLLGVFLNKVDVKTLAKFEQKGVYENGYFANGGYRQSTS